MLLFFIGRNQKQNCYINLLVKLSGSPRLDILIYTLIAAQSPVNSGGATKQKSNFSKI
jgi:hypothetical protein